MAALGHLGLVSQVSGHSLSTPLGWRLCDLNEKELLG